MASLSTGAPGDGPDHENLNQFLAGLPELWHLGEVRPTHRKAARKALKFTSEAKTENHRRIAEVAKLVAER